MSAADTPTARPFTPASLAKEWECSERLIRSLISSGELQAFKLGEKLIRIPAGAAADYVRRRTLDVIRAPEVAETDADQKRSRMAARLARKVAQKGQR